ncbi:10503_t:CDS:2, partial [Cetraspora pellucida]
WGDEEDSGWDDTENIETECKTPKSTYYDKYGPNGIFTKAAVGTKKITSFFNNVGPQITNSQPLEPNELDEISNDSGSETDSYASEINKRAIYEYLCLLSKNNGHGKIKASLELPLSRHGKHQKTIRIIDDEDIKNKCHIWIRSQNFEVTPATFKTFIEDELFPTVFAFDNSSNHGAFSKDALIASKINLDPGGKQPIMHDTYFGENNQLQSMVFPERDSDVKLYEELYGKLDKELRVLEYKKCKEKVKDTSRVSCCAHHILSLEPDFLAQKNVIQELIENAGHKCIFFPKFHCELNFIERYWRAAKRHVRENCDYLWKGLQKTVPKSLKLVSLITIRKFSRKCWRYMDLYRNGLSEKLVEYAVKKYKTHRRIPDSIYEELDKLDNIETL